ncbi:hypothetical protein LTR94_029435, partial [Friedmanniomyces endolithicus]
MTYTRTLAFLLSSCAIAPAALAQTTSSQSPQGVSEASPPSEDAVDDIIVTGIRRSLSTANDVKRDAPYIVDAIAAEDLGKFPDQNVAESLQRITGVAITRTVGGEGQSVSVRGLGPQFNVTTVNGRVLATSNGGRDFSFDVLPSEVISGAQVYKTTMASLEEGSIGGTVNMSTARPL